MPDLSLEDLRARVARLEQDAIAIRALIDKERDDATEWRHTVLSEKLTTLTDAIWRVGNAFDQYIAGRKQWAWARKLGMVAAATTVAGFVGWLAWQLLHLWATIPVKP